MTGGLADTGIYQPPFPAGADLSAATSVLNAQPGVASVQPVGTNADIDGYPVASSYDNESYGWRYSQLNLRAAGNLVTEKGHGQTVGIIYGGEVFAHSDMHVVKTGKGTVGTHGVHTAGLACARNNTAENISLS